MENTSKKMEKIVSLCQERGFVYPGSQIYGGLANTWDYGPLGVELKNNIKKSWWKAFVQKSPYNVGLDSGILLNPKVWEASGHVGNFSDPQMDCKLCKTRHRADQLIEAHGGNPAGWSFEQMQDYIAGQKLPCPECGGHDFTEIRKFNLMFQTALGVTEDNKKALYLRPETAQGIFVDFKSILRTTRRKLPFGVAQIGKSFRNEITPGNFIFRVLEFEQMELEFFCKPGSELEWFGYWKDYCKKWLLDMGMAEGNLKLRDHSPEELSFYSNATTDFEYLFPFGWGELWGVASRTSYDLTQHQTVSGEKLEYTEGEGKEAERFVPYVIEPSLGVDRVFLAFMVDAYDEEVLDAAKNDTRTVLRLHPDLAPYRAAVLPLSKKLLPQTRELWDKLCGEFNCDLDHTGNIGKLYRRQDEIGTPYCVTVDFQTLEDNCVTVRDRDTMAQERVPMEGLSKAILKG